MTKELQDQAWSVLPKEFKEEVKRAANIFSRRTSGMFGGERTLADTFLNEFIDLFGRHNLTSDAEGEEMLTVEKSKVQEVYKTSKEIVSNEQYGTCQYSMHTQIMCVLENLFGSKCLPDDTKYDTKYDTKEPKPAEPKFKVGNMVRYKRTGKKKIVFNIDKFGRYLIAMPNMQSPLWVDESDLKPYAEPKYYKGEKVRYKGQNHEIGEIVKYWGDEDPGRYSVRFGKEYHNISENNLEPYTEPKGNEPKETMKMKPIESKVSVYLATAEDNEEFRQLLHENGFKWNGGRSLIDTSMWELGIESAKTHFIYPDKTVTYEGDKTPGTLTFSEFKKQYFEEEHRNLSQKIADCKKQLDNILKDSFRNERRLNIAVQILSGIVASDKPCKHPVKRAVELTDALLAEYGKGGKS